MTYNLPQAAALGSRITPDTCPQPCPFTAPQAVRSACQCKTCRCATWHTRVAGHSLGEAAKCKVAFIQKTDFSHRNILRYKPKPEAVHAAAACNSSHNTSSGCPPVRRAQHTLAGRHHECSWAQGVATNSSTDGPHTRVMQACCTTCSTATRYNIATAAAVPKDGHK